MSCSTIRIVRLRGDAADQRHRLVRLAGAHAGGRLVEAQELRLGRQRDADFQVALLAMRQVGGQFLGLAAQPDLIQHRLGLVHQVAEGAVMRQHAPAVAARLGGDADVFEDARIRQDVGDLVRAGDALPRDAVGRQAGDVLAVERDMRPEVGRNTPVRQLKNVLLPAPLGPITARISPRCTAKLTWFSAVSPPKRIVSASVRSSGSAAPAASSEGSTVTRFDCPAGPSPAAPQAGRGAQRSRSSSCQFAALRRVRPPTGRT